MMDGSLRLLTAASFILVLSAPAFPGQRSSTSSAAQGTEAVGAAFTRAEKAVEKAAADVNLELSGDAKTVLAVEAVRQESASQSTGGTASRNGADIARLVSSVTNANMSDAGQIRSRIAASKAQQVRVTIPSDIKRAAAAAKVTIDPPAETVLVDDLNRQTQALARSGLSVGTIKNFNESYLASVYAAARTVQIDRSAYTQARDEVFKHLVRLTISSVPPGADVQVAVGSIGKTDISKKPFEPGKMYQFIFSLPGFKTVSREYYVSPAPVEQTITEILQVQEPSR